VDRSLAMLGEGERAGPSFHALMMILCDNPEFLYRVLPHLQGVALIVAGRNHAAVDSELLKALLAEDPSCIPSMVGRV
jgi:hypothetical protein